MRRRFTFYYSLIFFFLTVIPYKIYAAENKGVESNFSKIIVYPPKVLMYPSGNPVVLLNEAINTISFIEGAEVKVSSNGRDIWKEDLRVDQILLNGIDIIQDISNGFPAEHQYDLFFGSSNRIKFRLRSFTFAPFVFANPPKNFGVLPPGEYEFDIKATSGLSDESQLKKTTIIYKGKIIVDQLEKK